MPKTTTTEERTAEEVLALMVKHSQRPDEGNLAFVEAMEKYLAGKAETERVQDPEYRDRALLAVHFGRPKDRQSLVCLNHSDVVGIENQDWQTDPWKLEKRHGRWVGRGVCDTHGCGTSMLLAGLRPDMQKHLCAKRRRVSLIFTYDEESTLPEMSMRGARLAVGDLDHHGIVNTPYFIAGEPTEMVPMRAHKGRFLAHFSVRTSKSGHVSERVQNALMAGSRIVHEISEYGRMVRYGSGMDDESAAFDPPFPTVQVTAIDVKRSDYSSTPDSARFTLDMRTLPDTHDLRVTELTDLINSYELDEGESVQIEVLKVAPGSTTPLDSPIVRLAERTSRRAARGFNGGDEGRIMRLTGKLEGVTLGPGELSQAHTANESIDPKSVLDAINVFADLYRESTNFLSSIFLNSSMN